MQARREKESRMDVQLNVSSAQEQEVMTLPCVNKGDFYGMSQDCVICNSRLRLFLRV